MKRRFKKGDAVYYFDGQPGTDFFVLEKATFEEYEKAGGDRKGFQRYGDRALISRMEYNDAKVGMKSAWYIATRFLLTEKEMLARLDVLTVEELIMMDVCE